MILHHGLETGTLEHESTRSESMRLNINEKDQDKQIAHAILDKVKAGIEQGAYLVNLALATLCEPVNG